MLLLVKFAFERLHLFPFLIGRIRALILLLWSFSLHREWFPFLIGRIRASGALGGGWDSTKFPFLIGGIRALTMMLFSGMGGIGFHSL